MRGYDITKFDRPSVTVDIVIFTVINQDLKVLLVKRKIAPFKDKWALPGGFVKMTEPLEEAARRELEEETGVKEIYLEQLYTFGDPKRDPRTRVITVSYMALIKNNTIKLKASTDVYDVNWFAIKSLPELAFDHQNIVKYAVKRLRWKLEYTTIGFTLLPEKFTLTNLQELYETIFDKKFDKRNFRKKILLLGLVKKTSDIIIGTHRPAKLFTVNKKIGDIIEII